MNCHYIPRHIIVTGCANCPFRDNTTMNEIGQNQIVCRHHSFVAYRPVIEKKYIDNLINAQSDMIHGDYFPDWCPLNFNIQVYPSCNCKTAL